jgi:hypothetical protein
MKEAQAGELEEDQEKDGLKILKKISRCEE